jgi:hypothetical protein
MAKVSVNWGAADDRAEVPVFGIYNTSHKCLYVLARDGDEAMMIAHSANHVYGTAPIIALEYSRHAFEVSQLPKTLEPFADAIQTARKSRLRGTLEVAGEYLRLGSQVIS